MSFCNYQTSWLFQKWLNGGQWFTKDTCNNILRLWGIDKSFFLHVPCFVVFHLQILLPEVGTTTLHFDKCRCRYNFQAIIFKLLYTTLPHDKLKTRLKETIHKAFSHRNYGSKFVALGYNSTYFSNKIQKGKTCYSEEQVISMLEFLIDNIFVSFGGILFQQVVGIPMGTNGAPLLAD